MSLSKQEIAKFILQEIREIAKPTRESQTYSFEDLETKLQILFSLLDTKIDEPTLARVGDNFYHHFSKIVSFHEKEIPSALEALASNFEAFLKLIAYLKYGESDLWFGDDVCMGIKNTNIKCLQEGYIQNKDGVSSHIRNKQIPEPLIDYKGVKRSICDFVRTQSCNSVDNSRTYSRLELVKYSNSVISCYLLAVEENLKFLKKEFWGEFNYLESVINEHNTMSSRYVDLIAEENLANIDMIGSEVLDAKLTISQNEYRPLADEGVLEMREDDINEEDGRVDNILRIAEDTKHLHIIGPPGSGKSTTLLKIRYNNSKLAFNGSAEAKIPLLINGNEYHPGIPILSMVNSILDVETSERLLREGRIQILFDGINEINEEFKTDAYQDINNYIEKYGNNSIVITERRISFKRRFNMPVYELKELNNKQVQIFIEKYAGEHYKSLWEQLSKNLLMLRLAYSPLILKMILVVSRKGEIPQNRGLLIEHFINHIFKREKLKISQVAGDEKMNILAYVAFTMKSNGLVSSPVQKFKEMIADYLRSFQSAHTREDIFGELLDNLMLKEGDRENISFVHETYQDYFCGVYIKQQHEVQGKLDFDFNDIKWLEALQMAIEIIKDKSRAKSFFEIIFRGQNAMDAPKPLMTFSGNDFNEHINIACKLAYSVKTLNPEIFILAEKYLYNYLVLWKYIYFESKSAPISAENLFAAVSSLNSERLTFYVLSNLGWCNIWLYSEYEENHNNSFSLQNIDQLKSDQFQKIIQAVAENAPEFGMFYSLVKKIEPRYQLIKSVKWRLQKLRLHLLKTPPGFYLSEYYQKHDDFDVFLALLKQDIDSLQIFHLQNEKGANGGMQVAKILIKYHIQKSEAHQFFLKYFDNELYFSDTLRNLLLNKLFQFGFWDCFFDLLLKVKEFNPNVYRNHIPKVQAMKYDRLPAHMQQVFINANETTQIAYDRLDMAKIKLGVSHAIRVNTNDAKLIKVGSELEFDSAVRGNVAGVAAYVNINHACLILSPPNDQDFKEVKSSGEIQIVDDSRSFILKYSSIRLTKANKNVEFELSDNFSFKKVPKDLSQFAFSVNGSDGWNYRNKALKQNIDDAWNVVSFKVKDRKFEDASFRESGTFSLLENSKIDFRASHKFHPDLVLADDGIMKYIQESFEQKGCQKFIRQLGISEKFADSIKSLNFGIIVNVYRDFIKVFSIGEQKFYEIRVFSKDIAHMQVEQIVVIENNYMVSPLSKERSMSEVGFKKSIISNVDAARKEGFIKKDGDNDGSDYYFTSSSCDFIPSEGDAVSFIPALNSSQNYYGKPIALRVSKD